MVNKRTILEHILARDTLIVSACIALLVVGAWWWLSGVTTMADPLSHTSSAMASMENMADVWGVSYLLSSSLMWALMMVAMMLPSAASMILVYARLARQTPGYATRVAIFVLAYLAMWMLFSIFATIAQAALVSASIVTGMTLKLESRMLVAALLVGAGLYQLSWLKTACLEQCQSPLSFLMQRWRPGWSGALRLGVGHGLYCLGCCWALMLLLFVGGVMNLAWIAILSCIVFVEKVAPLPIPARKIIAFTLVSAGAFMALSGNNAT